jgi:Fe-S cluster biogenesis protein NfuA
VQDRELIGRVEARLAEVEGLRDRAAADAALETVQAVLELYGSGLERILERLGPLQVTALATDELVAHLLLLHGLHPVPVEERVREALDGVRPYLGSHGGGVELVGVAGGVATVRLQGTCEGCPASAMTLKLAIEEAVLKAAPDVERVEAEADPAAAPAAAGGGLLQIELVAPPAPEGAWATAGALPQLSGGGLHGQGVAGRARAVPPARRRDAVRVPARVPGLRRLAGGRLAGGRGLVGAELPARAAGTATTSCARAAA